MDKVTIEIHAAEGGDHAKRLVKLQAAIYERVCLQKNWGCKRTKESL